LVPTNSTKVEIPKEEKILVLKKHVTKIGLKELADEIKTMMTDVDEGIIEIFKDINDRYNQKITKFRANGDVTIGFTVQVSYKNKEYVNVNVERVKNIGNLQLNYIHGAKSTRFTGRDFLEKLYDYFRANPENLTTFIEASESTLKSFLNEMKSTKSTTELLEDPFLQQEMIDKFPESAQRIQSIISMLPKLKLLLDNVDAKKTFKDVDIFFSTGTKKDYLSIVTIKKKK